MHLCRYRDADLQWLESNHNSETVFVECSQYLSYMTYFNILPIPLSVIRKQSLICGLILSGRRKTNIITFLSNATISSCSRCVERIASSHRFSEPGVSHVILNNQSAGASPQQFFQITINLLAQYTVYDSEDGDGDVIIIILSLSSSSALYR